jgi:RNA methyltransferase, TrmH family
MNPITSAANPRIKELRALRQRKEREESGLCLVEGIRVVGEALEAGAEVTALYYAPDLLTSDYALGLIRLQEERGTSVLPVAAELFRTLTDKDNPQGLIALVRRPLIALAGLAPSNLSWGVALVSPQDPGNIGTIIRTLDAVGAAGLILIDEAADPTHPAAVRASMGTLFWHPLVLTNWDEFVTWAHHHSYHLYGTSAHNAIPYTEVTSYQRPAILLLGSEREGLTEEQRAVCERLICLPMLGHATSLNLAVAAGVMLYEILRNLE